MLEPGAAPESVTGQNSSSTSILVMWDEVPADQQNGIIIQSRRGSDEVCFAEDLFKC